MPNGIKYTTGSIETGCLKKGNMLIANNTADYGSTFYTGITPAAGGYTIYLNKATGGPSIYTAANDADLISLSNTIAGQTFATSAAALSWFATQTDKMVFNIDYPAIVTNGLVLNLDAGFTPSYPTTGTIWYDLSSSGRNGTLINGPTFNSAGFMSFDGTNDYVSLPSSVDWTLSTTSTVNVWCSPTSGSGWIVAFDKGSWNGWFINVNTFLYNGQAGSDQNTAINGSYNVWQLFTAIVDRENGFYKTYKNGVFVAQTAITHPPITNANNLYLSSRGGVPDNFYNGKTASVQLYNRALSVAEILQNYYAFLNSRLLVTSGLVLNLQAGNPQSYTGTGTTWYDVSGNNNHGTLMNGVTYSTQSGGSLVFDGADDYVQFTSVSAATICIWGIADSGADGGLRGLVATSATTDGALRMENGSFRAASPNAPDGNDFQTGYVSQFMINGQDNLSINASGYFIIPNGRTLTQNFFIGAVGNNRNMSTISETFLGRAFKGKIFSVLIYNRRLSSDELQQVYNSQRSLYGL